jgi:hypothetical protein
MRILSIQHTYGIYEFISTLKTEAMYSAETFRTAYHTTKR